MCRLTTAQQNLKQGRNEVDTKEFFCGHFLNSLHEVDGEIEILALNLTLTTLR